MNILLVLLLISMITIDYYYYLGMEQHSSASLEYILTRYYPPLKCARCLEGWEGSLIEGAEGLEFRGLGFRVEVFRI